MGRRARGDLVDRSLLAPLPLRRPSAAIEAKVGPIFDRSCGPPPTSAAAATAKEPVSGGGGDRKERMLLAQTLWDATMAHRIARQLAGAAAPGSTNGSTQHEEERKVMHCCGRMHAEHYLGIGDHLDHYLRMFQKPNEERLAGFTADDRSKARLVVCLSSDESLDVPDAALATDPHLAHIADFVVVCAEAPDPAGVKK